MLNEIGNIGDKKQADGKTGDLTLKIEGDPHSSQKVRNFFSCCSIFKKVSDNTLLVIIAKAERPAGSNMWVPIVYTQSKNENIACSYAELLHWYNLGHIVKIEAKESMSELVAKYKKQ